MTPDVALLSLDERDFVQRFTQDDTIAEWLFAEMKAILQSAQSEEPNQSMSKVAENLLLIAVRLLAVDSTEINVETFVERGVLSLPRIVLMCSLYHHSNSDALSWWLEQLWNRSPSILEQLPILHHLFHHVRT
jgi:hypothetical protein